MAEAPGSITSDPNKTIATRPRKGPAKYKVDERERKVRTYPFSASEVLTLSVLNPAAACLLGWGINTAIAWSAMTAGTDKYTMGIAAAALIVFGGVLQILSWGLLVKVLWECKPSTD